MSRSFPALRFCLLVGIGGGVPSKDHDIRLGDVVVSQPTDTRSGVVQYDLGKTMGDGTFRLTGTLARPPRVLMKAISNLASDPDLPPNPLRVYLDQIAARNVFYGHPGQSKDILFGERDRHNDPCNGCDPCNCPLVERNTRPLDHPQIFYGIIASGNQVVKSSKVRDILGQKHKILCLEMEAAGIMNTVSCLVIRGICDYADSHKNKVWQEYAAATAAAYTKLLLSYVRPLQAIGRSNAGLHHPTHGTRDDNGLPPHMAATAEPRIEQENLNTTEIKPSTMPEPRLAERKARARRRQFWNPWPNDALRIFHSLERWMSAPSSSLLVLEASPAAQPRAEDLAFEVVDFLQTTPYTVIHGLLAPVSRAESAGETLKSVVFQVLRTVNAQSILNLHPVPSEEKDGEGRIWELFRSAVSQLHRCFLILESRETRYTERLLAILSETINSPKTLVKIMILAYTSYLSPTGIPSQSTYEVIKIPPQPAQARRKTGSTTGRASKWKHLKPGFSSV